MKKIYDKRFYEDEGSSAFFSAQIILPYVMKHIKCKTVIDFGCGTGEWLKIAKESCGIEHILGIDGEYVKEYLKISENEFLAHDLTKKLNLNIKYDLAISLEVAEHLPINSAKVYVQNLTEHADIILFSAAIPYQGGTSHMNEQYPSYWKVIFCEFGFSMCDCLRTKFWNDKRIDKFYRQNMFIYCKKELKQEIEKDFMIEQHLEDIIHPDYWEKRSLYNYIFPFEKVIYNKNVIIYGAGMVGKAYVNQLSATQYAKVVLWCDRSFENYEWLNCGIVSPKEITKCQYDYIVIALESENVAMEIVDSLDGIGVEKDKIIWRNPIYQNKY